MNQNKRLSPYITLSIAALTFILTFDISQVSADVFRTSATRELVQIDPETEELNQVSEPIGEVSMPVEDIPAEPVGELSETAEEASEPVGEDVAAPEPLSEVSESDDRASEEIGDVSETAGEASEHLPGTPEGEEYGLEDEANGEEMPIGDREAEGRLIGE
ncbi:MAG: hypothetical protein RIG61_01140 [Deltaproteobacteria bacterium]